MNEFDNYEEKSKVTFYVILVLLVLFVSFIVILIFKTDFFGSREYLIVGNNLIWNRTNDGWVQIKPKDVKSTHFTLYNDLSKTSADRFDYLDKWKFYKGKKVVSNDDFRIAFSKLSGIKVANFSLNDYEYDDEKFVLEIANTDDDNDYNLFRDSLRKATFDFDGDGSIETLYVMSDFLFGNGYRTPYSYMFTVKDDVVVDSIFEIDANFYHIIDVIDMNGDGNYEIIVSKGALPLEDFDSCYQIYNLNDGYITLTQDCMYRGKE